jgi:hypothetical protein
MRRGVSAITTIVVLLLLAAVVFVAFTDSGESKEPLINGVHVRRYVASAADRLIQHTFNTPGRRRRSANPPPELFIAKVTPLRYK